ncbi:MOSC domain-containing protein [Salinispirillum marinum]|uniref:MOSC domain-containing protein n=2 Tax=Saccharospirillaceae TaxID=255527 RepID=A0ABV8BGR1_9GAMM
MVSGLWVYPVKGMSGNPVASLRFDEFGPIDDRRWMLMDEQGRFICQRRFPLIGLFKASVLGQRLTITAPDGETKNVSPVDCVTAVRAQVWSDDVAVRLAPDAMNQWLSQYFSQPVYLVCYRTDLPRSTHPDYAQAKVGFADGFPLLVCLEESLAALNQQRDGSNALSMLRFRPNIVLSGAPAWQEQYWLKLTSDTHQLTIVKPCTRCAVVTIEPGTTERDPSVLRDLMRNLVWQKQPVFGQNAVLAKTEGALVLGDSFDVFEGEEPFAAVIDRTTSQPA